MIPQAASDEAVRPSRPFSAVDDVQVSRGLVERDRPVLAAHDDVLDTRSVLADQVDPGFDREGHPDSKRLAVAGDDVRILVTLETDAVPRPMEEGVAVALRFDWPA